MENIIGGIQSINQKKYQVKKYEYDRALQDYSIIFYKIKEIKT